LDGICTRAGWVLLSGIEWEKGAYGGGVRGGRGGGGERYEVKRGRKF